MTFQMDRSSGAGRGVRRGVSGEEGGSAADTTHTPHTRTRGQLGKGRVGSGCAQGPTELQAAALVARLGMSKSSQEDPYVRESQKLCVHVGGSRNERVGLIQAVGGSNLGLFPF